MTTVLFVDDDPELGRTVPEALAARSMEVLVTADEEAARKAIREREVDVVLLDARLETEHDGSLVKLTQSLEKPIPTILMMAAATARDAEAALDRGVAGVLDKPFTQPDLLRALDRALSGESFRGRLSGLSLLDMFQVFNLSRRSLVVDVGVEPPARVWFEHGQVVHAERGERVGEPVLESLLDISSGQIRTLPFAPAAQRSIERPFHSLLLDMFRARDEATGRAPSAPPAAELEKILGLDASAADTLDTLWPEPVESSLPSPKPLASTRPPLNGSKRPPLARDPSAAPRPAAPDPALTAVPDRRMDMMCRALTVEVQGALAVALIDLEQGELLGLHNTSPFTPEFEQFIANYTRSLFRGPEIQHIERTMQHRRGFGSPSGYLEEVVLTSRHTHHLTKVIAGGRVAIMVVTPRRAQLQEVWAQLKAMLPMVEANLG